MSDSAYTDAERDALTAVLDTLVPPSADGRLPGAGELGLAAALEREVPVIAPLVREAVARLDALAVERGAARFAELDAGARSAALHAYHEREPGFVPGLVFQVYTRYYTAPRVVEGLGVEPRPPFPKGYEMEPIDLESLLAPVRERGRRWREV